MFQKLLSKLNNIAQKYNVRIANVATRYIIDKAAIAGVIIGVKLGIADLKNSNAQVFSFSLGKTNYDDIECEMYKVQIICLEQLEIVVNEFR